MDRNARRQDRQAALQRYRRDGLPAQLSFPAMFAHTAMLARLLARQADASRARVAARAFLDGFETSLAANPPKGKLACSAGCSMCCHNWISVSTPELLLIGAELVARPDAESVAAAAAAAANAARGLDRDERLVRRLACAMLVDHRCSIYVVRPLACRAFFSLSLDACRRVFDGTGEDIPVPRAAMTLRGLHDRCMWAALKVNGLPYAAYELGEGIAAVLAAPDAEARWLAGEDILAGVTRDQPHDDQEELFLDVLSAGARGQRLPANPWTS